MVFLQKNLFLDTVSCRVPVPVLYTGLYCTGRVVYRYRYRYCTFCVICALASSLPFCVPVNCDTRYRYEVPCVSTRARRTGRRSSTGEEQRGAVRHHDSANSTRLRTQCACGVVTCVRAVWLHTIPLPVHTGLLTFPPVAKAMAIAQQPVCMFSHSHPCLGSN